MEVAGRCEGCGENGMVLDAIHGVVACDACGRVGDQTEAELRSEWQTGHIIERRGTYVGQSDTGVVAARLLMRGQHRQHFEADGTHWRERYRLDTMKRVDSVAAILRVPKDKIDEAKQLLHSLLNGEWGSGRWVDILVAACLYIVIRQSQLPLTVPEVADCVNCDVIELGRMYNRVLQQLEISLPNVDTTVFLERATSTLPALKELSKDVVRKITKEGCLLLNYAQDCFIPTGRRPLPVVAAVLFLVVEANKVVVEIAEVARELHAGLWTTKKRYKECQTALVGIGQSLPWGKDITLKTVPRHLPFLLQYLELKSKLEKKKKRRLELSKSVAGAGLERASGCAVDLVPFSSNQQRPIPSFTSASPYGEGIVSAMENGTERVPAVELPNSCKRSSESFARRQADGETLNSSETSVTLPLVNGSEYNKFALESTLESIVQQRRTKVQKVSPGALEHQHRRVEAADPDICLFAECGDNRPRGDLPRIAESNSIMQDDGAASLRISSDEQNPKSVKWEGLPVAFCASQEARTRRRVKIDHAKERISEARQALTSRFSKAICVLDSSLSAQSDQEPSNGKLELDDVDLDSEDLLIEHLVLSGASEQEIENGYYDTLLALYPAQSDMEFMNDDPESYIRSKNEVKLFLELSARREGDSG